MQQTAAACTLGTIEAEDGGGSQLTLALGPFGGGKMGAKEIPEDILPVFKIMDSELSWIMLRWNYFQQLYRSGPDRIELLNAAASTFFVHLRRILADDIILAACRITDPPESCGEKNMTLARLIAGVQASGQKALIAKTEGLKNEILRLIAPFREHRKKRIAHMDYIAVLEPNESALPGITLPMIEELLTKMAALLNEIQFYYTGGTTIYDMVIVHEGADSLIQNLKAGLFFEELLGEQPLEWQNKFAQSRWYKT